MQETFIKETYLSDEECTMCNADAESTLAMVFVKKDEDSEMKMTVYFCPSCLDTLPDEYFNELDDVEDIEEFEFEDADAGC